MYRTIDAKFWHDQKIRKLSRDGRYFVLYLVTNPHSHLSGLYYLPTVTVSHETGLQKPALDTLWHTLSSAGLAYRDDENQVVWVVNMLSYQGRGSKNAAAALKQAQLFSDSPLVARFIARYPQFADSVSIGYPAQDQFGTPEQEQEQEQEREQEQRESARASKSAKPTIDEVKAYCLELGYSMDAEKFWHHFEARGWRTREGPIKSWKSAVVNWQKNERTFGNTHGQTTRPNHRYVEETNS